MFPKDGEKVPEVRFADFHGDWEQHKLKDILNERNEKVEENSKFPLMSFIQGKGVVPKGKRYDRGFLVKDDKKKYKKTLYGDFIYSSNNLETGSIGMNKTGNALISPVYSIFYSKNKNESKFISILSSRNDFLNKMLRFRQGVVYGQWRINEKDFLMIENRVPPENEQQSIINLFNVMNQNIYLIDLRINELNEIKKYCLQKLFI